MNKDTNKITKDTNIAKLVFKYPQISEIMLDYGLYCAGCFASAFDTIGEGSKIHGLSDSEIDEMVERINDEIKKSKKDKSN